MIAGGQCIFQTLPDKIVILVVLGQAAGANYVSADDLTEERLRCISLQYSRIPGILSKLRRPGPTELYPLLVFARAFPTLSVAALRLM